MFSAAYLIHVPFSLLVTELVGSNGNDSFIWEIPDLDSAGT